jgi:hypothetical protein
MQCALQSGEDVRADKGMISRLIPQEGDYWVVQEDGYTYLNPKSVFERKYHTETEEDSVVPPNREERSIVAKLIDHHGHSAVLTSGESTRLRELRKRLS